jgi:proliferating cell nuclear antigen PCNA
VVQLKHKMQCTFTSAKNTYDIFKFISQFEDHVKLECSENGIGMFTMSNCNSVFLDVTLPVEFFASYTCKENVSIGLNLLVLLNALSNSKPTDSLTIKCENENCAVFTKHCKDQTVEYVIKQMTIEDEPMQVPELEENVTVKLTPSHLKRWKKGVLDFTKSTFIINPRKDSLHLSSVGDGGTVNLHQSMPAEGIEYLRCDDGKPVTLGNKNIIRACTLGDVSDDIEFGYQNNMPFRFSASLNGSGSLRVFMAPCISDMDDE